MSAEFPDIGLAAQLGEIVVSGDTSGPMVCMVGDGWVLEQRGVVNPIDVIEGGRSPSENSMLLSRCVNQEGEVFAWQCKLRPIMSPQTLSAMRDAVGEAVSLGYSPMGIMKRFAGNLPTLTIEKNAPTRISFTGGGSAVISGERVHFTDALGSWEDEFLSGQMDHEGPYYKKIDLPLTAGAFLGPGISADEYTLRSRVMMRGKPYDEINGRLSNIIQNGSMTEGRIRSLVNICFELERNNPGEEYINI